jgi:hypothetical protein
MPTELVIFLGMVGFLAALKVLRFIFEHISRGQPLPVQRGRAEPGAAHRTSHSEWFSEARTRTGEENADIAASAQRRREQSFAG